jgi:hypothetical protein
MSEEIQRRRSLAWLWCAVPAIVAAELFLQWRIPNRVASAEEWQAAAAFVRREKRAGDLVVIAPAWATQGRVYLGASLSIPEFGAFDTDRYGAIVEVSLNGARAVESRGLAADQTAEFGHLRVTRYPNPNRRTVLFDFVSSAPRAVVGAKGRAAARLVIDHWFHPRLAVPLTLGPKPLRASYADVPLEGTLRAYAVIGYREGRFDKGEPVKFAVYVNDRRVIERSVANFAPIEPIEVPLGGAGTGTVAFEASAKENLKREFSFAAVVLGGKGGAR